LLNILKYTFEQVGKSNIPLTPILIKQILAQPNLALVIVTKKGVQFDAADPIPKAIHNIFDAITRATWLSATLLGKSLNDDLLLTIMQQMIGDSSRPLDENTYKTLTQMRFLHERRLLPQKENSIEENMLTLPEQPRLH
jgi:hypothetical protein